MNCSELREYLFAFLDSELDSALSIEVQRHLEQCPECAREAEIERAIRRQLSYVLHESWEGVPRTGETELEASMEKIMLLDSGKRRIPWHPRRWGAFLATAAVLGVAIIGGVIRSGSQTDHTSNQFVDLLVADFEHFQEKGIPLQIASSDPQAVSAWLAEQTALRVSLPDVAASDAKLLGARKCKIDGKPAAFTVYDVGGTLASLVVMPGTHPDIDNMEHVERDGLTHWVDRCKGHTVLACKCKGGALVYAAVSRLPEERLVTLINNVDR